MSATAYTGPLEHGPGIEHDQPAGGLAALAAWDVPALRFANLATHSAHRPTLFQATQRRSANHACALPGLQRGAIARADDFCGRQDSAGQHPAPARPAPAPGRCAGAVDARR